MQLKYLSECILLLLPAFVYKYLDFLLITLDEKTDVCVFWGV